jgi:hypothetical protein
MPSPRRCRYYCRNPRCTSRWKAFMFAGTADTAPCPDCGERGPKLKRVSAGTTLNAIPDIPSHWNESFGKVVRGRRHLKELQAATGSVDYETSSKGKDHLAYGRERARFEMGRR